MTDIATFEDRYGDERTIHKTRHGLKVKSQGGTPTLQLNQAISKIIGARIRELRLERGWSLEELAVRAGIQSTTNKNRMWEIENAIRGHGVRMGTLYAVAMGLGVEATNLMASVAEVADEAGVRQVRVPTLEIK